MPLLFIESKENNEGERILCHRVSFWNPTFLAQYEENDSHNDLYKSLMQIPFEKNKKLSSSIPLKRKCNMTNKVKNLGCFGLEDPLLGIG